MNETEKKLNMTTHHEQLSILGSSPVLINESPPDAYTQKSWPHTRRKHKKIQPVHKIDTNTKIQPEHKIRDFMLVKP
jgi:hypothetical protein